MSNSSIPQLAEQAVRYQQIADGFVAMAFTSHADVLATQHATAEEFAETPHRLVTSTIVAIGSLDAEYAGAKQHVDAFLADMCDESGDFRQPAREDVAQLAKEADAIERDVELLIKVPEPIVAKPQDPGWAIMQSTIPDPSMENRREYITSNTRALLLRATTNALLMKLLAESANSRARDHAGRARKAREKAESDARKRLDRALRDDAHLPGQAGAVDLASSEGRHRAQAVRSEVLQEIFDEAASAAGAARIAVDWSRKHAPAVSAEVARLAQPPDHWRAANVVSVPATLRQLLPPAGGELRADLLAQISDTKITPQQVARVLFDRARQTVRESRFDIGIALRDAIITDAEEAGRDIPDDEEIGFLVRTAVAGFIGQNADKAGKILKKMTDGKVIIFHSAETGLPFDGEEVGAQLVYVEDLPGMMIIANVYSYDLADLRFFETAARVLENAGDNAGYYTHPEWFRPNVLRMVAEVAAATEPF